MGVFEASAASAPDASLKEQLEWLGSQRLVYRRGSQKMSFAQKSTLTHLA
jgi:hypothetical protein